jgi:pyrimidine-specific ribonucleoside hydrolase
MALPTTAITGLLMIAILWLDFRIMKRYPIILDVDTGFDDAFALLFAALSPEIELLGVTCVDGNTNVEQVVRNTLKVLDAAEAAEIPVSIGATRPLIEEPFYAEHIHGKDGMGDLGLPESNRKVDHRNATELLRDLVEKRPGEVTLVPVAPLTNIANFISKYPESAKKLKSICLMGGSASVGNATAMAEFNIWHDPEAADIVFKSGIPITMYGLDVFYRPLVNEAEAIRLSKSNSRSAEFAGKLLLSCIKRLKQSVTLGDYGAVAAVIRPAFLKSQVFDVAVELAPGLVRGMTVVDKRPRLELLIEPRRIPGAAKVNVILDLDGEAFRDLWFKTVEPDWA